MHFWAKITSDPVDRFSSIHWCTSSSISCCWWLRT